MSALELSERAAPQVVLQALPEGGGSPTRIDLGDKLLSFTFVDSDKKVDKMTVTLDNWDLSQFDDPTWFKGNILEVSWGYVDQMSPTRRMVIRKVTGFQVLTIEAHGLESLLNQVHRSRTFPRMTRSEVVTKIAKENGFKDDQLHIEPTTEKKSVVQARQTDAQLIKKLANLEDFEFFVDFDGFHWHERNHEQRPHRLFTWYNDPDRGDIKSIHIENDITALPGRVRVKGIDPLTKEKFDESADHSSAKPSVVSPIHEVVPTPAAGYAVNAGNRVIDMPPVDRNQTEEQRPSAHRTKEAAQKDAASRLRRAIRGTIKLTMEVIGEPLLLAKTVVTIENISKKLSGNYYVSEVTHKISRGSGYDCSAKCKKDGHGVRSGVRTDGKKNTGPGSEGDPNALGEYTVDAENRVVRQYSRAPKRESVPKESK